VKPQCPQPLPVTSQGLKDELGTLFVKVKKTQIFVQSTSQVDLETAIQTLEEEIARRAALIKRVEENPGANTPEDLHPAAYLDGAEGRAKTGERRQRDPEEDAGAAAQAR
jgi:hypothetical protein